MPRRSRTSKRRRELDLADSELDLIVGPSPPRSKTDLFRFQGRVAELEAAWWRFRDELLADCHPGSRPWGWWIFEAREKPPPGSVEQAVRLAQLGELQPAEIARLRSDAQRFGTMNRATWDAVSKAIEKKMATKGGRG
jgi:hypothetical protein